MDGRWKMVDGKVFGLLHSLNYWLFTIYHLPSTIASDARELVPELLFLGGEIAAGVLRSGNFEWNPLAYGEAVTLEAD